MLQRINKLHINRCYHKQAGCAYLRYALVAVPITIGNAAEFGLYKTTFIPKMTNERHHCYCYTADASIIKLK